MKVRPVDIDIPKHDPFKHDLLDRKETVQALTRLLQNLDSPFTMAVDSPWGNGKTTFLGMWKKHLKTEGFPVVGFNAWETDFAGTPFVALASELLYNLDLLEDSSALNLKTLKNSMQSLCKIFWTTGSAQLISLGGAILSVQQEDPMFGIGGTALAWFTSILTKIGFGTKHQDLPQHPTTYLNVKSEICSFKSELQNVANSLSCKHDHKPLIIAIDKLDRCRPSYAVELLEIAKHFFSVENIVFVLAIDKSQLTHSIKALYGNEFNASGYLRRFIDLEFRLPEPDRSRFVAEQMVEAEIIQNLRRLGLGHGDLNAETNTLLSEFLKSPSFSLRQIQQAISRLRLALASSERITSPSYPAFTLMILLRTLDSVTYHRFVRSDMTDKEVWDHLFESPGLRAVKQTEISALFEALLIMADDEFRKKNNSQRKPTESSLHSYYQAFEVSRSPDPSLNSRTELVFKHLDRFSNYPLNFVSAAHHTELLYDILPNDPTPPNSPDKIHRST